MRYESGVKCGGCVRGESGVKCGGCVRGDNKVRGEEQVWTCESMMKVMKVENSVALMSRVAGHLPTYNMKREWMRKELNMITISAQGSLTD